MILREANLIVDGAANWVLSQELGSAPPLEPTLVLLKGDQQRAITHRWILFDVLM